MGRAEPRSRCSSSHSHFIPSVLAPSLSCLYAPRLPWMLAQLRAYRRPDSMLQATSASCASLLVTSSTPQPSPVPTLCVLAVTGRRRGRPLRPRTRAWLDRSRPPRPEPSSLEGRGGSASAEALQSRGRHCRQPAGETGPDEAVSPSAPSRDSP